jgi:hypothetical protein
MDILRFVIGGALLLAGRRLFWLFVGAAGFVVGLEVGARYFPTQTELVQVVIALIAGILFAILAILVQRIAVAIAGFLIAGYLFTNIIELFAANLETWYWLPFVIGGIIGAILVSVLFDWALIVLSSLAGAAIITQALALSGAVGIGVILALTAVGVIIQASTDRKVTAG